MRTYGRVTAADGTKTWHRVTTDADGFNDHVYLTALAQVLKLNINESPFYGNYGIPARDSVMTQVHPDFYVAQVQIQFSRFFASLIISKRNVTPTPYYDLNVTTHQGVRLNRQVPIPT